MRPRARGQAVLAAAVAAVVGVTTGAARADADSRGAASVLEELRVVSVEPAEGGHEITVRIEEAALSRVTERAIDAYLRDSRPQLFSRLSLGMVRYEGTRVELRDVRVRAHPRRANTLEVDVRADVVADQQERELVCQLAGWRSECDSRWLARGTAALADIEASAQVRLSLRDAVTLSDGPLSAALLLSRMSGSLRLGALAGIGLDIHLDPPRQVDQRTLALPAGHRSLDRFGDLVVSDFHASAAPGPDGDSDRGSSQSRAIDVTATVVGP